MRSRTTNPIKLRVLPSQEQNQAQDCGSCLTQSNCFSGDTEFITESGTKRLDECVGTEQVVLSRGGKWVKATIRSFGVQPLLKVTLRRYRVKKEIFTTAGHEWFVHPHSKSRSVKKVVTTSLKPGQHLHYSFGKGNTKNGISSAIPSPFGIAHGFVFGDGSKKKDSAATVHLFGAKDAPLRKYFQLCSSGTCLGGEWFGQIPDHFKDFPSPKENTSYLIGWLMGYLAADGTVNKTGLPMITSTNRINIEFFRDVCHVVGIGTYSIQRQDRISNLTGRPSTLYTLCLMPQYLVPGFFLLEEHRRRFSKAKPRGKPDMWHVESVEPTNRVEEVFCAVVPKYHSFTLDGNILTSNCWMKGIKEEHIITNLLVCRIKRGIEVTKSAKLFLEMVRPALMKAAKKAIQGTNIDMATAMTDFESKTIEYLQNLYVMGDRAYPMHFLFGLPNGYIRRFANNYAKKTRRYEAMEHLLLDDKSRNQIERHEEHTQTEEETETAETKVAREVIEDGISLTLHEYRILKFCLSNATEAKRPLNGLHVYLARTMGCARARVTKIFADASKRVVQETKASL